METERLPVIFNLRRVCQGVSCQIVSCRNVLPEFLNSTTIFPRVELFRIDCIILIDE